MTPLHCKVPGSFLLWGVYMLKDSAQAWAVKHSFKAGERAIKTNLTALQTQVSQLFSCKSAANPCCYVNSLGNCLLFCALKWRSWHIAGKEHHPEEPGQAQEFGTWELNEVEQGQVQQPAPESCQSQIPNAGWRKNGLRADLRRTWGCWLTRSSTLAGKICACSP